MTSSSGVGLAVELLGSSADGGFLSTLTTWASNHAPMLVSRASTYSLTWATRTPTCHSHVGGTLGLGCPLGRASWQCGVLGSSLASAAPHQDTHKSPRPLPGSSGQNHPTGETLAPGARASRPRGARGSSPGRRWPREHCHCLSRSSRTKTFPGDTSWPQEGSKFRNVTATTLARGDTSCPNARLHP